MSLSGCGQHINYEALKTKVEARQVELSRAYCNDNLDKDSVVKVAQHYLFSTMVAKMFPAWYGTRWDYNGTTQCPKKGKIACGYFVTTTMRDMGFNVPRVKWAQAPSETMIKQMTGSSNIKRYRFSSIDHIKREVRKWGEGIYVVGMDSHVGYIVNLNGSLRFVHSDFYNKNRGVISEALDSNNPLKHSKYRVVGKILTKEMTRKWLEGKRFG